MWTRMCWTSALSLVLATYCALGLLAQSANGEHTFDRQEITVEDFAASGYILDIGGGGEGIIGQMKPKQVIAIDLSKQELQEAPAGPLKIIMDATDLQFLDGTFSTATSFYTLMYIDEAGQKKVFKEVFRVLVPGGRFLIWDVVVPEPSGQSAHAAIFPFTFHLPGGKVVKTGYGVHWPPRKHDLEYYRQLAAGAGFKVVTQAETKQSFTLALEKP